MRFALVMNIVFYITMFVAMNRDGTEPMPVSGVVIIGFLLLINVWQLLVYVNHDDDDKT